MKKSVSIPRHKTYSWLSSLPFYHFRVICVSSITQLAPKIQVAWNFWGVILVTEAATGGVL